ncbi:MAG: hypothetical protein JW795_23275 [Chitinivibrionales bacterium]|nr:hypothetical protein [Chitinivibrionales bacterium]
MAHDDRFKTIPPMRSIAHYLSIVGNPLVFLPLSLFFAALTVSGLKTALLMTFLITAGTSIPMFLLLRHKVKRNEWTDLDVSNQRQRRSFYYFAFIILACATVMLWLMKVPPHYIKGSLIGLVTMVAAMVINYWIKISLHIIIDVYLSVILLWIDIRVGIIFCVITVAVAWSRVALRRHTALQVFLGMIMGIAAGLSFIVV